MQEADLAEIHSIWNIAPYPEHDILRGELQTLSLNGQHPKVNGEHGATVLDWTVKRETDFDPSFDWAVLPKTETMRLVMYVMELGSVGLSEFQYSETRGSLIGVASMAPSLTSTVAKLVRNEVEQMGGKEFSPPPFGLPDKSSSDLDFAWAAIRYFRHDDGLWHIAESDDSSGRSDVYQYVLGLSTPYVDGVTLVRDAETVAFFRGGQLVSSGIRPPELTSVIRQLSRYFWGGNF